MHRCTQELRLRLADKQKSYVADLEKNHASLGHLINIRKYAKYDVHKPDNDLYIDNLTYWGGWLCMMWLLYFVLYLPEWL